MIDLSLSLARSSPDLCSSDAIWPYEADSSETKARLISRMSAFLHQLSTSEIVLNARHCIHSPELDLSQVLGYYEAQSRREDVNFYFSGDMDWRISHLLPACRVGDRVGYVISNLLAAMYRLRHDDGITWYSMQHFIKASTCFRLFDDTVDQSWLLACIVLYLQYDSTANRGKEMAAHMKIAAKLISSSDIQDSLPLRELQNCLATILAVYDVTNALLTGVPLFLEPRFYLRGIDWTLQAPPDDVLASIEQMWQFLHSIWAQVTVELRMIRSREALQQPQGYTPEVKLQHFCGLLFQLNDKFQHSPQHRPSISPISFHSPIGPSILYRSAAYRLQHATIHMLLIICISFSSENDAKVRALIDHSRDQIITSHTYLFNSADQRYRIRKDERQLHQTFPATAMLMIAASEVHPRERRLQKWLHQAAQRMNAHGWSLGILLMRVITGSETSDFTPWQYLGTKQFLFRAWFLREQGIA